MLSLILFRHGKSDWNAEYKSDKDRPLAQRGVRAARRMGEFLAASGQLPELALSSSAVRARDTLDLARRQGHWQCPVQVKPMLYMADSRHVLELLNAFDATPTTLLLTAHEPTCSELTARLIGAPGNIRFPTAAMARIDLPVESWEQVQFGHGELRWLVPPKLLKGGLKLG